MDLLVTGGSGLVGHALQKILPEATYISSKNFDLTKEQDVQSMYKQYKPTHVIHLAARVGGIKENINYPAEFLYQNVLMNSYVIHYAYKYQVKKLIGILSNCAYPDVAASYPLVEEQLHDGPPAKTNFSYGYSKRLLDAQITAYRNQYHCNFFSVIPCSIYGPFDKFEEEKSHFLTALIKKLYLAKKKKEKSIKILGTGKPLRQYIYSEDLAKVLLLLLEKYSGETPINIAPHENLSIAEITKIALQATDLSDLKVVFDPSFPDGQYRKDLSNNKLFTIIDNVTFTPLSEGIQATYEWLKQREAL